ncbi:MAG: hypothetical protein ACREFI_02260 [Stellaceae bacterium]
MIGAIAVDERAKRQRARNWAILALLAGFVALVYVITLVKLGAF